MLPGRIPFSTCWVAAGTGKRLSDLEFVWQLPGGAKCVSDGAPLAC